MIHGWWQASAYEGAGFLLNNVAGKEPLEVSNPISWSKQGAQGSTQQVLNTNITDVTPFPGFGSRVWSIYGDFFLFYPARISHVPSCACCLPSAPLRRAWFMLQLWPPQWCYWICSWSLCWVRDTKHSGWQGLGRGAGFLALPSQHSS